MWKTASFSYLLIIALLAFGIFRVYELNQVGETWDEIAKVRNGQLHLKAIAEGDFSFETWAAHKEHPPLGKILIAIPTYLTTNLGISVLDDYIYVEGKQYFFARLTSMFFALMTIVLTYKLGVLIYSKKAALFAASLLAIYPHFVAYSFTATLESVKTFFLMLLIYAFFIIYKKSDLPNFKNMLNLGVIMGLGLLAKLSSLIYIIIPALFIAKYKPQNIKDLIIKLSIYGLATITIFYIFWPLLWGNPISNFLYSLDHFAVERSEYFRGIRQSPPLYYFAYYYLIATPMAYWAILAFAPVFLYRKSHAAFNFTIMLTIIFAVAFIMSFSSFKQDGIRYLHFTFPIFCLIGGATLTHLLEKINFGRNFMKTLIVLGIFGQIIYQNFTISPYYSNYYNEAVGGPKNVYENRLAQIGWWGEGVKQMFIEAQEIIPNDATTCLRLTPMHVFPINIELGADYYIPHRPELIGPRLPENTSFHFHADWRLSDEKCLAQDYLIISTLNLWSHEGFVIPDTSQLIHIVDAKGAPLVMLYKN